MVGHRSRLGRRIRRTESTSHIIKRRPCLIISLPAIMGYWNVSFVFLFVYSMIFNPNIYSSSIERPNNKLPLSSLSLCVMRASSRKKDVPHILNTQSKIPKHTME